jgi:hypothetical protein
MYLKCDHQRAHPPLLISNMILLPSSNNFQSSRYCKLNLNISHSVSRFCFLFGGGICIPFLQLATI